MLFILIWHSEFFDTLAEALTEQVLEQKQSTTASGAAAQVKQTCIVEMWSKKKRRLGQQ